MAKYHIIFGTDDYRATIDRPDLYLGYNVSSIAFVCPFCLEVWARIAEANDKAYRIQPASCYACPPTHWVVNSIPGSIIDDNLFSSGPDFDLLDALPDYLLKREYNLHLAQYDRYLLNEPTIQPNEFGCYTYADLEAFDAAWCGRSAKPVERRECPG